VIEGFRAEGLAIGLYYSHIDWHHPDGKYFSRSHWDYDESRIDADPASWDRFAAYEKGQIRESLTNYGKIDLIWYDIHWPTGGVNNKVTKNLRVRKDVLELLQLMKTLQPGIIFNDRGADKFGGFDTPEQQVPATALPGFWESNITITNEREYWYKGDHVSAESIEELIRMLVEISAKGGSFLTKVGPRPDGELSNPEYAALAGVGEWMNVNSESIYGTDKSLFVDLPWGWSTTTEHKRYLHVFDWPADGKLIVPGLRSDVAKADRLADSQQRALKVSSLEEGKSIARGNKPNNEVVSVVVLEVEGKPDVYNTYRQTPGKPIELSTAIARVEGTSANYNFGSATRIGNFVQDIKSPDDRIHGDFLVRTPGEYVVKVNYAAQTPEAGSEFAVRIGGLVTFNAVTRGTANGTGDLLEVQRQSFDAGAHHNNLWTFQDHVWGTVTFTEGGNHTLEVAPIQVAKDYLAFVKSVCLS
jgi:alpha-L-fucosidase